MPEEKSLARKRVLMYIIGFVFNLTSAIPAYVNSNFLEDTPGIGAGLVGIVYTAGSILALAAFIEMSGILRRFGNFRTTLGLLFLEILSLAGMAAGNNAIAIASSFVLNFTIIALINFTIDVFLEEFSSDRKTGRIRGAFLSIENIAWFASPFVAGLILKYGSYSNIYATSCALLIPVILLVFFGLRDVKDPPFQKIAFWKSFATVWANRDVKGILMVQFLLQFFYSWMVIYTPIYLKHTIGFDWPTIFMIFTVMLSPFVLLSAPLGRLSDKSGEKTLMGVGLAIMGISTLSIAAVTDHNPYIWAFILFMTRVGAATLDVTADSYFFKHVEAAEASTITFSRMMRPLAYVIAPIVATVLFFAFDIKGLFVFLGFLMLYGLRYVLALRDTKATTQ